jgi:hypothetical protein
MAEKPTQRGLAKRAAGKPAFLKIAAGAGDNSAILRTGPSTVEFGDVIVGVIEHTAAGGFTIRGGTVAAFGSVGITAGGSIASGSNALVFYFDFSDPV